ncbi:MAG: hypothetical protein O3C17_03335 [Planctomycetota bacterium]|nr:hypothetical protein [Planctomycetota bacterium]
MIPDLDILELRAQQYGDARSLRIVDRPGSGYDGIVFSTEFTWPM